METQVTISGIYKEVFSLVDKLNKGAITADKCRERIEVLRAQAKELGLELKPLALGDLLDDAEKQARIQKVEDRLDRIEPNDDDWCAPSYDDDYDEGDSY